MKWINITKEKPPLFLSVLGYMPDLDPFPTVRECYYVGGELFFIPALSETRPIKSWAEMPEVTDAE